MPFQFALDLDKRAWMRHHDSRVEQTCMFVAAKLCWVVDSLHDRIDHVQRENKLKGEGK